MNKIFKWVTSKLWGMKPKEPLLPFHPLLSEEFITAALLDSHGKNCRGDFESYKGGTDFDWSARCVILRTWNPYKQFKSDWIGGTTISSIKIWFIIHLKQPFIIYKMVGLGVVWVGKNTIGPWIRSPSLSPWNRFAFSLRIRQVWVNSIPKGSMYKIWSYTCTYMHM